MAGRDRITPFVVLSVPILISTTALLLIGSQAAAEPLTFANVTMAYRPPGAPPTDRVFTDLFSNPGIVLISETTDISIFVDIRGTLPLGGTDTLRLTLMTPGFDSIVSDTAIPNFGTNPPFTVLPRFDVPLLYQPVMMNLVVDLLQSSPDFIIPSGPLAGQAVNSFTYSFAVVEPVPEPATIILVAGALGSIALRPRRFRRRRAADQ